MKRMVLLLLACLLVSLSVASLAQDVPELAAEDFTLTYQRQSFALGEAAAPLLAAMADRDGGAPDCYEAESCLFSGMDKEYTGAELIVATYPIGQGGADQLETIIITSGDWVTARGIGLGATLAELEAAYGTAYTQDGDTLTFALGDPLSTPILLFTLDPQTQTVAEILMMNNTGF